MRTTKVIQAFLCSKKIVNMVLLFKSIFECFILLSLNPIVNSDIGHLPLADTPFMDSPFHFFLFSIQLVGLHARFNIVSLVECELETNFKTLVSRSDAISTTMTKLHYVHGFSA